MKANHKSLWTRDTRAQVGIGTMIVFIATILVAATAAAVLIDTSGKLSERSSTTGNEATKQVASNLLLNGVYATRAAAGNDLQNLFFKVGLAAGGTSVDLAQMKILISDGDARVILTHDTDNVCDTADTYCATELRDPKLTFTDTTGPYVISKGGLFDIQIQTGDMADIADIPERTTVTVILMPEVGASVHADFTTPPTYGQDLTVHLR